MSRSGRWQRAQEHERRYWRERGDVEAILARRWPRYEGFFGRISGLLPERAVVADVGCGPTCWARFLPGTKVFADPLMHSYARRWAEQLPEGYVIAAAGEALPLRNGSCDLVLSINALDHCADPSIVVRECVRVAKPGGLVVISIYAQPFLRAACRRLCDLFAVVDAPHPHVFTPGSFLRLVKDCGLQGIETMELGPVSFRSRLPFLRRTEWLVLGRVAGPVTP